MGCWIRTNWRRHFGPCQSLTSFPHSFWLLLCFSLTHSHSFPVMFLLPNKWMYKEKKKLVHSPYRAWPLSSTHSVQFTPPTCPLPHFKYLWVFFSWSLLSSLSPCFTFLPRLPFCSLIDPGCECALPDYPHCPFTLSALPRITLVAMVTSLPPCWKTSLCLHKKKRYLPPAESRAVGQPCRSVISICYNVISSLAFSNA